MIRESAQLMAIACTTEIMADIAPGYQIRPLSEAERGQQMKKDTKKLVQHEEKLLSSYLSFLTLLEKAALREFLRYRSKTCLGMVRAKESLVRENTFTHEIGMLSVKSLATLLKKLSHFNYNVNLVSCLVRVATSAYRPVCAIACEAIEEMMKADVTFRMSLHCVKCVGQLVGAKRNKLTPRLLYTLLALKVRVGSSSLCMFCCHSERGESRPGRRKEGTEREEVQADQGAALQVGQKGEPPCV